MPPGWVASHAVEKTTDWYRMPARGCWFYGQDVTVTEPSSLDELISDCADIPRTLRSQTVPPQTPRTPAAPWRVDEACAAQVSGMDDY
jgi:hypothetical protein